MAVELDPPLALAAAIHGNESPHAGEHLRRPFQRDAGKAPHQPGARAAAVADVELHERRREIRPVNGAVYRAES